MLDSRYMQHLSASNVATESESNAARLQINNQEICSRNQRTDSDMKSEPQRMFYFFLFIAHTHTNICIAYRQTRTNKFYAWAHHQIHTQRLSIRYAANRDSIVREIYIYYMSLSDTSISIRIRMCIDAYKCVSISLLVFNKSSTLASLLCVYLYVE